MDVAAGNRPRGTSGHQGGAWQRCAEGCLPSGGVAVCVDAWERTRRSRNRSITACEVSIGFRGTVAKRRGTWPKIETFCPRVEAPRRRRVAGCAGTPGTTRWPRTSPRPSSSGAPCSSATRTSGPRGRRRGFHADRTHRDKRYAIWPGSERRASRLSSYRLRGLLNYESKRHFSDSNFIDAISMRCCLSVPVC